MISLEKITSLEELIKNLNTQLETLTQALSLEKSQHAEQRTTNERIKTDLEKLEERLKQLQDLLNQAQVDSSKKEDELKISNNSMLSTE